MVRVFNKKVCVDPGKRWRLDLIDKNVGLASHRIMEKNALLTGGAGFIGSHLAHLLNSQGWSITVLDALTYAGSKDNLSGLFGKTNFQFVEGKVQDGPLVRKLFKENKFSAVFHLAAESHVDRSIYASKNFIETNILGTFELLEGARAYFNDLSAIEKKAFRFVQVSTDEVYGELGDSGQFTEETPYKPSSPYSASKAAGDHLAHAWFKTYGLPVIITNCTNNYGPRQLPEKLIPRMITQALKNEPLPVYGKGLNVRDWIHVEDHCRGLLLAYEKGKLGETYAFGGRSEMKNIEIVNEITTTLDKLKPTDSSYSKLITFVADRLGHDWRYAVDDSKAQRELGYFPKHNFNSGLRQTIEWYLGNHQWVDGARARTQESFK